MVLMLPQMTLRPAILSCKDMYLPFVETLPEGMYALQIGLYTRGDGQRLERVGELSEAVRSDRFSTGYIR